jgi:hypothetical protein
MKGESIYFGPGTSIFILRNQNIFSLSILSNNLMDLPKGKRQTVTVPFTPNAKSYIFCLKEGKVFGRLNPINLPWCSSASNIKL